MQSSHATTESLAPAHQFGVRLSSTRRGARLARRLAVQQLAAWGIPYDSETSWAVAAVTAELAANAITHGRVPGRDFRLTLLRHRDRIRVEVTDTRPECRPPTVLPEGPAPLDADSGRGLFLVAEYTEAWGCESEDTCTKTVWAEIPVRTRHQARPGNAVTCTSAEGSDPFEPRPPGQPDADCLRE